MERLQDIEEKNNVVNINLDSFIDYLRNKDFEIEYWRSKHLKELKKSVACDEKNKKAINYIMTELITEWDIKNGGYVSGSDLPVDAIIPLLNILQGDDKDETNS